ncbi:hypothetical protein ADIWIN_1422 [Winogradskyella psychrotolerans RS-3]|uniref:Uncharacterized protein n=2 Tax=Winogradskyella TaxID=286104 RepID=S7VVH5_9FLAO|nr:hypothetical protein ADIWIN_1422 [Winogradskyella psychrotolerans RS-3]
MNNYIPQEVIEQVNTRSTELGGLSFVGMIENAINIHPQGKEMGMEIDLLEFLNY